MYGVYISHLIRYHRACDIYTEFIDRARLQLLNQRYVDPKLRSPFLNILVKKSQTKEDLFLCHTRFDVKNMAGGLLGAETAYTSVAPNMPKFTPIFYGINDFIYFYFLVLCMCCLCLN